MELHNMWIAVCPNKAVLKVPKQTLQQWEVLQFIFLFAHMFILPSPQNSILVLYTLLVKLSFLF